MDLLAFLEGFRFTEAHNKDEKEKVFRLRYDIYSRYGHIERSQFPDKLLHDKDDEYSISLWH